jgi:protein-L-isoaspartate(D-aspartate) O-methyltransferase
MEKPASTFHVVDHSRPFLEVIREEASHIHPYPERLVTLFETIPRELFVPDELREMFLDKVQTDEGCAGLLSQPGVIFQMVARLFLHGEEHVLEGGTGTGYQTALLARLAKHVYTIERDGKRLEEAKKRLESLGITNITYIHGDAALGLPRYAPFDRMIFGAAIHGEVDQQLIAQMASRCRILIPTGTYHPHRRIVVGDLWQCEKKDGHVIQQATPVFGGTLTFVPLVSERPIGWTPLKGGYIPSTPLARFRNKLPWN